MRLNQKLLNTYLRLKQTALVKYSKFHHVDDLEGPVVLVLAPHPDDDIFGCGGTLLRHQAQGHAVYIVYLCQGDKGIVGKSRTEAAQIRKQESMNAAKIVGVAASNLFYLSQPDEKLAVNGRIVGALQMIIEKLAPNLIYLPSFTDNHVDHFQTNLILRQVKMQNILVAGYEIWTPHIPNRLVNITNEMATKQLAIREHKSQLLALDYLQAITGLNSYRAALYPGKRYSFAESFMVARKKDYFDWMGG